jgi:hypothetical protein
MYWVELEPSPIWHLIRRSHLDGSDMETIRSGPIQYDLSEYRFLVGGFVFDPVTGRIFFYDFFNRTINRLRPDGSDEELLFQLPSGIGDTAQKMAVDPIGQKILWINAPNDQPTTIKQSNFDGSEIENVIGNLPENNKGFFEFAIDPYKRTLTWLEMGFQDGSALVYQANLDGLNPTLLADVPTDPAVQGTWPEGLLVDPTSETIYWTSYERQIINGEDFTRRRLYRYDSNTATVQLLVSGLRDRTIPAGFSHDPTFRADAAGPRHVKLTLPTLREEVVALRVTLPDYPCLVRYVGASGVLVEAPFAQPVSAWSDLAMKGAEIVPNTVYSIEAMHEDGAVSVALSARSRVWGDVTEPFGIPGGPTQPDFGDIHVLVNCFRAVPGSPMDACDLYPDVPNGVIDFQDISSGVDAFRGRAYPFSLPQPCP